jgi:hypothetical protein
MLGVRGHDFYGTLFETCCVGLGSCFVCGG